jgi:hypothetical protein
MGLKGRHCVRRWIVFARGIEPSCVFDSQCDNVALVGDEGAAQVLDYGLIGGPCRDRTYDQLIKRSFLARDLFPSKTSTHASPVVPRFVDLRTDKALIVLLKGFSNGKSYIGMNAVCRTSSRLIECV